MPVVRSASRRVRNSGAVPVLGLSRAKFFEVKTKQRSGFSISDGLRDTSGNIVAEVEFMKDGPEGAQILSYLERVTVGADDDGDDITSCVVRPSDAPAMKAKPKLAPQAALALRILCDTINDEGEIPPASSHIPPNKRTITEEKWRANFYAGTSLDDSTPGTRQKAFVRASNKLQKLNLIGKWGDHIWLV